MRLLSPLAQWKLTRTKWIGPWVSMIDTMQRALVWLNQYGRKVSDVSWKQHKNTKNAFFVCFWAYVWQSLNSIGWSTSMPLFCFIPMKISQHLWLQEWAKILMITLVSSKFLVCLYFCNRVYLCNSIFVTFSMILFYMGVVIFSYVTYLQFQIKCQGTMTTYFYCILLTINCYVDLSLIVGLIIDTQYICF